MVLSEQPFYVPGFRAENNVRELGGWPCADGRRVRGGLLYRGASPGSMDASELRALDGLGLAHILDLRAVAEAADEPYEVPRGCAYERVSGMYYADGEELDFSPNAIRAFEPKGSHEQILGDMLDMYAGMLFGNPAMHRAMELLEAGETPLYVHCASGKDRTGMAAALWLMALGCDDETIVCDYGLTNVYRAEMLARLAAEAAAQGREEDQMIAGVREEVMRAMLARVDARYATREAYLADEFGLDAARLARVRERYCE